MMNHFKSSLSAVGVVAAVMGMVACGGESRQQSANAPVGTSNEYAQQTPPASTDQSGQYGSAMGQPGGSTAGGETGYGGSSMSQGSGSSAPSTTGGASGQLNPQSGQGQNGQGQMGQGQMGQGQMGQTREQSNPSTMGAAGGGTLDVSSLNDAQLAAVVQAINQGEIQEAQLAQQRAANPDVKRFARDMMTSHRNIMNEDQSVLSQAQITPSDNAVSQQLRTDSQSQMSTLEGMRGKDFDREYIDSQIKDHNKAIELIDRIIPNVKNPQLKAQLQNARPRLEAHLREAERVQQKLQGSTNMQNGSSPGQNQDQNHNQNSNPNQNQNQNQGGSQNPY
jgi:putative membrane protein